MRYAFLPASSTRGNPSSTSGAPWIPNTRNRLFALMEAKIATVEFHGGPRAGVVSH